MEQQMVFPGDWSLHQMIELSNVTGSLEREVYFCRGCVLCNGKSLLGLVVFFSHLKKGDTFVLKVEGEGIDPCRRIAEVLDSRYEVRKTPQA
ncbi:MAG: hypothetical protein M0Z65_03835 [Firmicutes bacterium]|nr:hypothetical protein [Melghirimyces thermohalophilus]MDA8352312.1 hypothetical protein [Bacillota bacterium]